MFFSINHQQEAGYFHLWQNIKMFANYHTFLYGRSELPELLRIVDTNYLELTL